MEGPRLHRQQSTFLGLLVSSRCGLELFPEGNRWVCVQCSYVLSASKIVFYHSPTISDKWEVQEEASIIVKSAVLAIPED